MLEQDRRLGHRVEELKRHFELIAIDLREQVGAPWGLESAVTRINHFTRLPVEPDLWPPG
jgi:hypothetical protein